MLRFLASLLLCSSFAAFGEAEVTMQSGLELNSELKCKSADSRPLEFSIRILFDVKNPYSSKMRFSRGSIQGLQGNMPFDLAKEFPVIEVFHNSNIIFARSALPHDRWEFEMRVDPKTRTGRFSAVQASDSTLACANCEDAIPINCTL